MTNFWGNSSSQYIAKKIIRPDFFATPGERVLLWLTFAYLVFWSCFGKAPIWCTKAYQNVTWFAAIFEAKRPKLHRTSRTTHILWPSVWLNSMPSRSYLERSDPNFIELPEQLHILWPSVPHLWLNSMPSRSYLERSDPNFEETL